MSVGLHDHQVRGSKRGKALISLYLSVFLILGAPAAVAPAPVMRPDDPALTSVKTIVDLQPFRETNSIRITNDRGEEGSATLINLNPGINAWYLLRLDWGKGATVENYHLENAGPSIRTLLADARYPFGLTLEEGNDRSPCDLWKASPRNALQEARSSGAVHAPLCGGKLYLRNPAEGYRTVMERAAEFLRNRIPAGEKIENFVRDTFFVGAYREKAQTAVETPPSSEGRPRSRTGNWPTDARLDRQKTNLVIRSSQLGIDVDVLGERAIVPGSWYPAKATAGVYISLIAAGMVAPDILRSNRNIVSSLDSTETDALVYLVAFDLDRLEVKFAMGTDHPRVNWSDHLLEKMKDKSLPGPDGIGTISPLVSTGVISPRDAGRTVAAFAGGFKRTHGAFQWGELAFKNFGSHYGFMENGVIFSRLQPGISTIYTLLDSSRMEMETWTERANRLLPGIASARQNGVPIITAFDPVTGMSVPGPLVSRWGEGNWSGSENKALRTLRAGAAVQETADGKRFLIYAVFTSATPSAMVRVFQAYQCRYAMPLDMNALELTYMALYNRKGADLYVQHLITGMSEADKSVKGKYLPRFISYPDNRDFFYLLRKEAL